MMRVDNNPDDRCVRRIVISCDSCGREVDDRQIEAMGGLLEMGWLRHFNGKRNEYFCPCRHDGGAK